MDFLSPSVVTGLVADPYIHVASFYYQFSFLYLPLIPYSAVHTILGLFCVLCPCRDHTYTSQAVYAFGASEQAVEHSTAHPAIIRQRSDVR